MTSIEFSMKDAILPPALANAALLIAAPSLGCLKTYTRALTDLYRAYSLPLPDLAQVLQYRPMTTSSITSTISEERQELRTMSCQEPKDNIKKESVETMRCQVPNDRIKKESVVTELDTVKQEVIAEYTNVYMACQKTADPYISIRNEKTPVQPEAQSRIPLLPGDQQPTNQDTTQTTQIDNCILPYQNFPEKPHKVLGAKSSGSSTQYKNKQISRVSILKSDGELRIVNSREEANIFSYCHMPIKYLKDNREPADGVISVYTFEDGYTLLRIILKDGHILQIPITNICEISSWKRNNLLIHYYSSRDGQTKTHCIQSQETKTSNGKVRSDSENNSAMLNWLHTFLG